LQKARDELASLLDERQYQTRGNGPIVLPTVAPP
jgi:hypothetical protein